MWGAVNAALKAYGAGGLEALKPKARGRKTGTKRLLSPEQEAEVRKLICDKRPEQMKMPFALWTREAVRQLILERFGVELAVRSVGEYLFMQSLLEDTIVFNDVRIVFPADSDESLGYRLY